MWGMSKRSVRMWTISEEDKVITCIALEIHSYVFLFCFDDNAET